MSRSGGEFHGGRQPTSRSSIPALSSTKNSFFSFDPEARILARMAGTSICGVGYSLGYEGVRTTAPTGYQSTRKQVSMYRPTRNKSNPRVGAETLHKKRKTLEPTERKTRKGRNTTAKRQRSSSSSSSASTSVPVLVPCDADPNQSAESSFSRSWSPSEALSPSSSSAPTSTSNRSSFSRPCPPSSSSSSKTTRPVTKKTKTVSMIVPPPTPSTPCSTQIPRSPTSTIGSPPRPKGVPQTALKRGATRKSHRSGSAPTTNSSSVCEECVNGYQDGTRVSDVLVTNKKETGNGKENFTSAGRCVKPLMTGPELHKRIDAVKYKRLRSFQDAFHEKAKEDWLVAHAPARSQDLLQSAKPKSLLQQWVKARQSGKIATSLSTTARLAVEDSLVCVIHGPCGSGKTAAATTSLTEAGFLLIHRDVMDVKIPALKKKTPINHSYEPVSNSNAHFASECYDHEDGNSIELNPSVWLQQFVCEFEQQSNKAALVIHDFDAILETMDIVRSAVTGTKEVMYRSWESVNRGYERYVAEVSGAASFKTRIAKKDSSNATRTAGSNGSRYDSCRWAYEMIYRMRALLHSGSPHYSNLAVVITLTNTKDALVRLLISQCAAISWYSPSHQAIETRLKQVARESLSPERLVLVPSRWYSDVARISRGDLRQALTVLQWSCAGDSRSFSKIDATDARTELFDISRVMCTDLRKQYGVYKRVGRAMGPTMNDIAVAVAVHGDIFLQLLFHNYTGGPYRSVKRCSPVCAFSPHHSSSNCRSLDRLSGTRRKQNSTIDRDDDDDDDDEITRIADADTAAVAVLAAGGGNKSSIPGSRNQPKAMKKFHVPEWSLSWIDNTDGDDDNEKGSTGKYSNIARFELARKDRFVTKSAGTIPLSFKNHLKKDNGVTNDENRNKSTTDFARIRCSPRAHCEAIDEISDIADGFSFLDALVGRSYRVDEEYIRNYMTTIVARMVHNHATDCECPGSGGSSSGSSICDVNYVGTHKGNDNNNNHNNNGNGSNVNRSNNISSGSDINPSNTNRDANTGAGSASDGVGEPEFSWPKEINLIAKSAKAKSNLAFAHALVSSFASIMINGDCSSKQSLSPSPRVSSLDQCLQLDVYRSCFSREKPTGLPAHIKAFILANEPQGAPWSLTDQWNGAAFERLRNAQRDKEMAFHKTKDYKRKRDDRR